MRSSRFLLPRLFLSWPLAALLATSLLLSSRALAQDASGAAEPAEYAALIDGALTEFQASRWREARALFERAHASFPNARTQRGIGMASFEMGDYPAATIALEAALASEVRPLTEEQRGQVETLLARARALVGHFVVPPAASDVRLSIDGVAARPEGGWPASAGRIALAVGTRELVLRDRDGRTSRTRIDVRGGEDDVPIEITPPGAPGSGQATGDDPTPWVIAGVGAALTIAGAILYGVGASDIAAVNNAPSGTEWRTVAGVYESAPVLTGSGLAALIAGGAMVVVGVGWGLERSLSSSGQRTSARLRLAPLGLFVEGTF